MRSLSTRQPWAGAIIYLGKSPENRSRRCPDDAIGTEIAVHAGKEVDHGLIPIPPGDWPSMFATPAEWDAWRFWHMGRKPRDEANWPRKLALGAVVGAVTITGCHRTDPDDGWCGEHAAEECAGVLCSPWARLEGWHWELSGARPIAEPVPVIGQLGLWTLPEDVEQQVRAQLGTGS